jgi:HD-like signal output (HDOD) protein
MYTLPAVAMQVVELTNRPTIDVVALKECIQNDPALTTKILRVANSSLFGLPSKVRDLNQALTLIGSTRLKLMVLGFSLPDELLSNLDMDVLKNYWRHALVKAVAAREISEMVWKIPGDEAFIAGLLQDVGMLALIQDLGRPYVAFLDRRSGRVRKLNAWLRSRHSERAFARGMGTA